MFRRRSSSRHQPLNTTPSASAQSAASKAFIANRNANTDLSSAAAAAALRSHTPPPTSPGDVQTRRMLQRQLSNSSRGSSTGGLRHGAQPTLRRTPSSGSMTSRTFRESSPGRPPSGSSNTSIQPPPVPPIPQSLSNRSTPPRRSASAQASRGMTSSPLRRSATGRGASLDRGPSGLTASPTSPRNFSKGNSNELERPGSRTSINFSYPMAARSNSPPYSPIEHSAEHSPTSPLSPADTSSIQQSINNAANRKVKMKPKTAAPGSKEGSHFGHKTMGSRPTGTALQDGSADPQQEPLQEPLQSGDLQSDQVPATELPSEQPAPVAEDPSQSTTTSEGGGVTSVRPVPKKRPSMVMEDHEGEERAEAADAANTAQETAAESPVVHTSQSPPSENVNNIPTREPLAIQPVANIQNRPSPPTSSTTSSPQDRLTVDNNIVDQQLYERQASISPNRSARFSNQLTVGSESPLHEPPSRSISPAKSALKNSSSPDRRIHLGQTPSEYSDGTSVASDDGSRAGSKKKATKVSFDDEAEVVGVAASPPTSLESNRAQSPVEKSRPRSWFGINKKKPAVKDVAEDYDFESVLRPRPALPSFGSIRGTRGPEEAAAVSTIIDDDLDSSSDEDLDTGDLGVSSDHAIGNILVNAKQHPFGGPLQKNTAKSTNEPSLSGVGPDAISKGVTSEVADKDSASVPQVLQEQSATSSEATETPRAQTPKIVTDGTANKLQASAFLEPVPIIAIQPATPGEESRNSVELHNMPGMFPSEQVKPEQRQKTSSNETPKDAKPSVDEADSDDESGESIYSDAAEDPTELQGDVFGSINAIVDSPLPTKTEFPKEVLDSPSRTVIQTDPLAKVTEPVPSPSLEAIHPRMPATPGQSQAPVVAKSLQAVNLRQVQNSGAVESAWPINTALQTPASSSSPVQQRLNESPSDPHEGSHLRKALGKANSQQQQQNPRQSLRNATTPSLPSAAESKRAPTANVAPVTNNAPPKRQAGPRSIPQSSAYPPSSSKLQSNDSDSDSSFKRTRQKSRAAAGGQYTMKRTMRAARPAGMDIPAETSTSLRASSMRTTLRGPAPERSSGFSSLRDKPGRSRQRNSVISSGTWSRVESLDNENSGGRKLFQSRFADSSDDDDEQITNNLTPVRGIPRRQGTYDDESTDLDDSSDDENRRRQTARNGVGKEKPQTTQEELDAIMFQPKKKGGIFSRLRSPNRGSGKDTKVSKSKIESPARRDTPLERSRLELARIRVDTINHEANRPLSPKLQKRQRAVSAFADTWPLPSGRDSTVGAPISNNIHARPSTSDGIINGTIAAGNFVDGNRPSFSRHGTADSIDSKVISVASDVPANQTVKKKRFPLLRKAFRLD